MFQRKSIVFLCLILLVIISIVPAVQAQDANKDVYGRDLPADAAPYAMQTWHEICDAGATLTTFSAVVSVYQRICGADLFSDALVDLDTNLNLIPAAADSWSVSDDGLTWTFNIRPGQIWSDGTPLTANDWVSSWRYMATPSSAYDFAWMWQGVIKNWSEAIAGEVPPDQIGMVAVDDNTLAITTAGPAPYLPATMHFWPPMQAKSLDTLGPTYILDPATSVSAGPFKLKEFVPGDHVIVEANPDYKGLRKPWLSQISYTFGDALNGSFSGFQKRDVDMVTYERLSPADFEVIKADPDMISRYLPNPGDFRTDYLLFDTYNPPFNDLKVRQAFAKALDRESIVSKVINASFNLALPAYSFLMPGFPASDTSGALKDLQGYDCPAAQQLLADAGYPGGEGFPAQELKLRNESDFNAQRFIASAASISDCLGVTITVNNMEQKAYMDGLNAKPTTIQFGAISYGMDYLDPANMLGVWLSTGRHSWRNADFDKLVTDAGVFTGDPAERFQMYKDAEKILVEDVGGIFLDHRIQGNLFQPYMAGGSCLAPNAQGVSGWEWGNDWCWGQFYVTNEVANYQTYRSQ